MSSFTEATKTPQDNLRLSSHEFKSSYTDLKTSDIDLKTSKTNDVVVIDTRKTTGTVSSTTGTKLSESIHLDKSIEPVDVNNDLRRLHNKLDTILSKGRSVSPVPVRRSYETTNVTKYSSITSPLRGSDVAKYSSSITTTAAPLTSVRTYSPSRVTVTTYDTKKDLLNLSHSALAPTTSAIDYKYTATLSPSRRIEDKVYVSTLSPSRRYDLTRLDEKVTTTSTYSPSKRYEEKVYTTTYSPRRYDVTRYDDKLYTSKALQSSSLLASLDLPTYTTSSVTNYKPVTYESTSAYNPVDLSSTYKHETVKESSYTPTYSTTKATDYLLTTSPHHHHHQHHTSYLSPKYDPLLSHDHHHHHKHSDYSFGKTKATEYVATTSPHHHHHDYYTTKIDSVSPRYNTSTVDVHVSPRHHHHDYYTTKIDSVSPRYNTSTVDVHVSPHHHHHHGGHHHHHHHTDSFDKSKVDATVERILAKRSGYETTTSSVRPVDYALNTSYTYGTTGTIGATDSSRAYSYGTEYITESRYCKDHK